MSLALLYATGLALLNIGWVASILIGLPGTWLMLATCALVDYFTEADLFSAQTLWIGAGLAVLGGAFEWIAGARGAKKAGAGKGASYGAFFGGILGALAGTILIPIPLVGSLLGAAMGAFALSTYLQHREGRDLFAALKVGRGAATGQVLGTLLKLSMSGVVWLLLTIASFW